MGECICISYVETTAKHKNRTLIAQEGNYQLIKVNLVQIQCNKENLFQFFLSGVLCLLFLFQ